MGTDVLTVVLSRIECCQCSATFALVSDFMQRARNEGITFHCPYCRTSQSFSKTENQRLRESLELEQRRVQQERARHDQTRAELRETELRRRAEKGQKTRIKNRVANGVCPCCNRTFQDLLRHMKSQHPEYSKSE